MDELMVLDMGREAMKTAIFLAGPLLAGALVAGVSISILQAITQVNEVTMTFIPKIITVALVLALAGPWMIDVIRDYTTNIFLSVPERVR